MAKITYADKEALNEVPSIADINKCKATDMNEIKNVVNQNETKILLTLSNTAPAQCSTNDMYFNTTDNLIYTATGTNTWGSTGVAPTNNTLYIVLSEQTLYAYNGTTLVRVGEGAGGETLPVGSEIDFDGQASDIPVGWEQITDPNSYSTSEVKTNKTWIDGKPIYRKTINFGALPNATTKSVAHGISNLDEVILLNAIAKSGNSYKTIPDVISTNDVQYMGQQIKISISSGNVVIYTETNQSSYSTYVTIEYTKTTD